MLPPSPPFLHAFNIELIFFSFVSCVQVEDIFSEMYLLSKAQCLFKVSLSNFINTAIAMRDLDFSEGIDCERLRKTCSVQSVGAGGWKEFGAEFYSHSSQLS